MASSVIQLKCPCKNDPWGKKGSDSRAARYAAAAPGTDFKIDENNTYSEMWMGTYSSNPALILSSGEELQKVLNANAESMIGEKVLAKFNSNLPFLPKILSIAKALPLQIHPDKELAAMLHERDPQKFTDTNHKPEIAVALSEFEAFVGWMPLGVIWDLFQLEPLKRFLPKLENEWDKQKLKELVLRLLSASESEVQETFEQLMSLPSEAFGKRIYLQKLIPRLAGQYSITDPGSLVALWVAIRLFLAEANEARSTMNYMVLEPGQTLFVPADGIHAWLYGDIVECMAPSDNMLSVGFSPRDQRDDLKLFTEAVSFSPSSGDEALLESTSFDRSVHGKTKMYAPPMPEFNLILTKLEGGEKEVVQAIQGPSIMVVTDGEGSMTVEGEKFELKEGYVFFIRCGVEVQTESAKGIRLHRAYCEA